MSVHKYKTTRGDRYQVRWRRARDGKQQKKFGFRTQREALAFERKLDPQTDHEAARTPLEEYCDR
jgi:hypothetical protein